MRGRGSRESEGAFHFKRKMSKQDTSKFKQVYAFKDLSHWAKPFQWKDSVSSSQCFLITTVSLEKLSNNSILTYVFLYLLLFSLGFRSLSRQINHDSGNWIQQCWWLKSGSRACPAFGWWSKQKSTSQKEDYLLHRTKGLVLINITTNYWCNKLRNLIQDLALQFAYFLFPLSFLELNTHCRCREGLDLI